MEVHKTHAEEPYIPKWKIPMADLPGIELAGGEIISVCHREAYPLQRCHRGVGKGFGFVTRGTATGPLIATTMKLRQTHSLCPAFHPDHKADLMAKGMRRGTYDRYRPAMELTRGYRAKGGVI